MHYVPQKPDDPEEQTELIDRALGQRPDAIVLVPAHPTAVNDAILRVNQSGIPLFVIVNRLTSGDCVSFISSDDYLIASEIARQVFDHLGESGDVVIAEGPPDSVTSIPRVNAFRDVAAGRAGINLVGSFQGAFLRDPAREAMTSLLLQGTHVDAVLAANDSMALGVVDALLAAGRGAVVAGINAIPEAIEAIKSGRMLCTADFSAMSMAHVATECAIRHLRGERVPIEIMLPVQVVDRDNCAHWDKPFAAREFPIWQDVVRNDRNEG
jgi:ribose transport system substrate-binding protein